MKTIFTIGALLLIIFSFGQTTFRTNLTGVDGSYFYDLVQMSDGSYIAVGDNYSDLDNVEGMSIVKLNAQGQIIISKNLVPNGIDENVTPVAIIKTSDGGFAVSGTINDTIALLKFDANLSLQWHNQYAPDNSVSGYGTRLVQTSDGGYMITGYVGSVNINSDYVEVGIVIKTTSNGTVSWTKQYFDYSEEEQVYKDINDIVATKDGNYLLLANNYSNENSEAEFDSTYLIKINGSGDILWSKFVSTDAGDQTPISVLAASDGSYVVCGYIDKDVVHDGDTSSASQIMLMKFDQSGNILWAKSSNNPYNYDVYINGIMEDKDGGYIMAGEIDTASEDFDDGEGSYFFKVNSNGDLQWTKRFTSDNIDQFAFSLIPTSDGGYAASGGTYSYDFENSTYILNGGTLYKFNSAFSTCGDAPINYGSLVNLSATVTAKSVVVHSLNSLIQNNDITVTTIGTGINLCSSLPLQLLSFNATLQNKSVSIEWKTANEVNTDYFTVERSNNTTAFIALQKVTAKGNSSNVQTYTTADLQPLFGTSYYRLKEVDKDGKASYSNIVPVTVSANGTIVISPNPVRDNIRVLLQSKENSSLTFQVIDMSGRVLAMQGTAVNAGANTVIIPASSLSKGLYVLKVIQNNAIQSIKFVKE